MLTIIVEDILNYYYYYKILFKDIDIKSREGPEKIPPRFWLECVSSLAYPFS